MTLSAAQKKFLHTMSGMVGASGGYVLVNRLSIGPDLKVPLIALCVGVIIRSAGALLGRIDTVPPGPPA